jgi:flagellar biosynthetic protein FliR
MTFERAIQLIPVYVLVLFRVAGMMVYAPLLGSDRIPKRVKALMACVLAAAIAPGISPTVQMPNTSWGLALGIGGEIVFGLAMGMILSFIFIAAQWAGEIIGQQMGLNLGETFDPQFGAQSSVVGDLYFFLTLVVFLIAGGHRYMLMGVYNSFQSSPLLSVGMDEPLFRMLMDLLLSATMLAMQLAAPVLVTMLVVDVILGFVGKTVPQLNIMTAGISLRSIVGLLVVIFGLGISCRIIGDELLTSMSNVLHAYSSQHS